MSNYLYHKKFNHYRSGVYEGHFIFTPDELLWHEVDSLTRIELKQIPFTPEMKESLFDLSSLYQRLSNFSDVNWEGESVILASGVEYRRYQSQKGSLTGKPVETWLWAMRGTPPIMDVVTLEGKVIAFIMPGRISSEMLILDGYETLTPFTKYQDGRLSPVEYGIRALGNHWVKTRDGLNLATEIFLPEGGKPDQKYPTIVIRTCYGKNRDLYRSTHWVNRGYAFVIQDVRGRSDSDGELIPFYYERDDAYDLFDWIKDQSWSNGKIGMWGASYLGYTTTAAATSAHPNLLTAISEVNVGSPFFVDTVRRGGAVCSWPLLCWTLGQSVSNRVDHDVFQGRTVNPDEVVQFRPLTEIPTKAIGKRSGPWDFWAERYYYDKYWDYCDNSVHGHNIKIPMLVLSGWHDGDAMGVQETWQILTDHDVPGRRIILGPWPHALNAFRDCLDTEYGNNAIDYDFDTRTIRWFDHYLKDIANDEDKQPRATYYLGGEGENKWYHSDDWNPIESTWTSLYWHSSGNANSLYGDGQLRTEPAEGQSFDRYMYDPDNAPRGDGKFEPSVQNSLQSRNDRLVYETAVLDEPVAVAGDIAAQFYASSSAVDTDFFVTLSDVDRQGVARKIAQNGIRAAFRNYPEEKYSLLKPNQVEEYRLRLNFAGHVFPAGHRIRVDICSADYMVFFPNTNTGEDPYTNPKPIIAIQHIFHGSEYPSCIRLPILYGTIHNVDEG